MLVDTHCHLNLREAFPDVASALFKAKEAGVGYCLVVGMDAVSSRYALELAVSHPEIYAIIGWHPNYSAHYDPEFLPELREMAIHPRCVAIGEIGFDFYHQFATPSQQERATRDQILLAVELKKPAVFHCRDAYSHLFAFLQELPAKPERLLLHCFSGDIKDAEVARELGCFIGVGGPLTYKRADTLRDIVASYPRDRVLLETDAPYLAPHPYRGKPNEPALLPLINKKLSELWNVSEEESARVTTENALRFFGLPSPPIPSGREGE
jgi:TatD DNase family protein